MPNQNITIKVASTLTQRRPNDGHILLEQEIKRVILFE